VRPTDDMPAPKGSRVLPALTDEDAKKLSDEDLYTQGYPRRPDARNRRANTKTGSAWFPTPSPVLPPHSVSRYDISHGLSKVEDGTSTNNWSGFETRRANGTFLGVQGQWSVPAIVIGEPGYHTHCSLWVGLDGGPSYGGPNDLIQAGTEQDYLDTGRVSMASYYAWSDILPNQPTSQQVSLDISPFDTVSVLILPGGGIAGFAIFDHNTGQSVMFNTAISANLFVGSEAEWIMERPAFNCPSCTYTLSTTGSPS
jgi:hypothetical protein